MLVQNLDERMADQYEVINKRLSYAATNVDLKKIEYNLQSYATLEIMQKFREEIHPTIHGCTVLLKKYAGENDDMR